MRLIVAVLACAAVLAFATSPVLAGGECCDKAKAANGWCEHCNHGFTFGVPIANKDLHTALAGKAVKADEVQCPGCKEALAKNGTCEHCKVMFAKDHAYKSPVSAALAKGDQVDLKSLKCPGCIKAAATGGYCSTCNTGVVAGMTFKSMDDYEHAKTALATLQKASTAKCPTCATAMVLDGECKTCGAKYKDGAKV
jgi:hypothetical protein